MYPQPHEDMGGGGEGIFQDQLSVYLFIWTLGGLLHMGHMWGVTISDFPGGDSSTNFLLNWQMQVYKSEFNKLSQRSL